MRMARYERYKDSGVKWLGEVPEHWDVVRLKRTVASCRNGIWGNDATDSEDDILCVRVADFDRVRLVVAENVPTKRGITKREREGRTLNRGDLLLEKSGGGDLQPVGAVVQYASDAEAVCSNFIAKISLASEYDSTFCKYLHNALYSARLTTRSINQTSGIQNLDQAAYLDELVGIPSFYEQQKIAAFLDRETAKIDALIEEQQRLIGLLKEKRQAVISHAVTKGLDPSVPMKDSGIEWLGQVPAHWQVGPLKRYASVIDCKHHTVTFQDEGLPVVSIRELQNNMISLDNAKLTSQEEWDFLREDRVPRSGDMIFCRNASVGAVGEVTPNQEFCMGQDVCLIRPNKNNCIYYFTMLSDCIKSQIESLLVGATIRRLNVEEIRNLWIAVPPEVDGTEIAKCLRRDVDRYDEGIAHAANAITLLQERRSALISAAVTGKIDVHTWKAEESV